MDTGSLLPVKEEIDLDQPETEQVPECRDFSKSLAVGTPDVNDKDKVRFKLILILQK